eukprot:Opistho-1_new@87267
MCLASNVVVNSTVMQSLVTMGAAKDGPQSPCSYPFRVERIPRYHWKDPAAKERIAQGVPVVLTGTDLVKTAVDRWSLSYLVDNIGSNDFTVYCSSNNRFMYHDETRNAGRYSYVPPTRKATMKFGEFVEALARQAQSPGYEKVYLQQTLDDRVGQPIINDFLGFNWKLLGDLVKGVEWGELTTNLLLVSAAGAITPAHYDEQQNFFAQVSGTKRCMLFSPADFDGLYPYPVHHPCDRQSQVDFDNPDYERFPNFRNVCGFEATIGAGDVLYIPMYSALI